MLVMKERRAAFRSLDGGLFRFCWKRMQSENVRSTGRCEIAAYRATTWDFRIETRGPSHQ